MVEAKEWKRRRGGSKGMDEGQRNEDNKVEARRAEGSRREGRWRGKGTEGGTKVGNNQLETISWMWFYTRYLHRECEGLLAYYSSGALAVAWLNSRLILKESLS